YTFMRTTPIDQFNLPNSWHYMPIMTSIFPSIDILYSRPGSESTTNRYCVGVGVMQSAHGALSSGALAGTGASVGWCFLSYGALRKRKYLKVPSVSNTWMRRLPRSPT